VHVRSIPAALPRPTPRVPRPQLRALTSFRFFACLAVFLHHCVDFTASGHAKHTGINRFLWEGWSGVSFFFVLSGFILAYNYSDRLTNTSRPALRTFYVSRVARIYPLYVLTFAIAAVALIGEWGRAGVAGAGAAISQVTLTQAFLPVRDPFGSNHLAALGFDGPAWSLSCEAFFYLSFPFLMLVLVRRHSALLAGVAVAVWAWVFVLALHLPSSPLANWAMYTFPPIRLAEFVVGVCGGLLFIRHRDRLGGARAWWTAAEVLALGLLAAAVLCSSIAPPLLRYASYYLPFFGFIILVFAAERGRVSRALRGSRMVFLGEISFAFYLLHVLVFRAAVYLGLFTPGVPAVAVLAGVFAVTLAGSAALFLAYEKPMRSQVRRRLLPAR
jgi:peptidoglycan/LPS O-acetylase OafA/YrhL